MLAVGVETVGEVAVRASGLVKRYDDLVAVDGLDLVARRGQCLGLLGPNGAGKTTTIEMLEGLKAPDGGEIEILGRGWARDAHAIRERIGVQLQDTELFDKITAQETVRMFRSFYAEGLTPEEVLALVGLEEKRDAWVQKLSGGQRQRLTLGCALVSRPEVLFLDEPTTGLDPQARRRVWEIVEDFKARGGTVLLTSHYMEEAERLSDDLVIIDHGKVIAEGSPAEIIASLGAESIVEVRPREESAEAFGKLAFDALPGVREVRGEGAGAVALSVTDTQACVGALLRRLDEEQLLLEDLRTHRPTLEDVFVNLTGKHLRDE
ncbi:MAG: ABC transporter ATP-binding protein [Planctomycetota bacterium]